MGDSDSFEKYRAIKRRYDDLTFGVLAEEMFGDIRSLLESVEVLRHELEVCRAAADGANQAIPIEILGAKHVH